ncbi:MAG: radical SAM protein [Candidatus Rokuibacteriota bacterium]|jgi:AdoMet-dependent heme synthase|nr:MAG: radical SAM protein [Candidatus Rokubacteria bacterium]
MRAMSVVDAPTPRAPFVALSTLWLVLTGTLCNLRCTHCLNTSGPDAPWLPPLDGAVARRAIAEAAALGVREIYFTGGEPFLHREILPLLETSLAIAATTVLTNGTVLTDATADALAALARASRYSLEIRVSLDAPDAETNDRVRGAGTWRRAVRAIRALDARGLLPIVTATEIDGAPDAYDRFRALLSGLGIARPRVKILPVFPVGRAAGDSAARLSDADLEGFDRTALQCADTRAVAAGGVYACPILAGLPGARLSDGDLTAARRPAALYHAACLTCHRTGATCRNA